MCTTPLPLSLRFPPYCAVHEVGVTQDDTGHLLGHVGNVVVGGNPQRPIDIRWLLLQYLQPFNHTLRIQTGEHTLASTSSLFAITLPMVSAADLPAASGKNPAFVSRDLHRRCRSARSRSSAGYDQHAIHMPIERGEDTGPAGMSWAAVFEPMKPAPPVMKECIILRKPM